LTAEKQRRFARRGGAIESASKQDERHIGESRYPAAFKARYYWFGLDSGLLDSSQARNDESHSIFWPDQY
jgi:hypothetical protein